MTIDIMISDVEYSSNPFFLQIKSSKIHIRIQCVNEDLISIGQQLPSS